MERRAGAADSSGSENTATGDSESGAILESSGKDSSGEESMVSREACASKEREKGEARASMRGRRGTSLIRKERVRGKRSGRAAALTQGQRQKKLPRHARNDFFCAMSGAGRLLMPKLFALD